MMIENTKKAIMRLKENGKERTYEFLYIMQEKYRI